jgi:hypothetical protein
MGLAAAAASLLWFRGSSPFDAMDASLTAEPISAATPSTAPPPASGTAERAQAVPLEVAATMNAMAETKAGASAEASPPVAAPLVSSTLRKHEPSRKTSSSTSPAVPSDSASQLEITPPTEVTCRALSRAGQVEAAVECFGAVSRGVGLSAEVSLHEVGRLELSSRRNPAAALRAFQSYRERYPSGALRGEVDYGVVRALADLGRFEEALVESEALLAKASGRSIAKELHLLRGRLYERKLHDCEKAVTEYVALVGDTGDAGDEAELGRARCLEALDRRTDAITAYKQYLRRSQPRQVATAKSRLSDLTVAESPEPD